MDWIIFLFAELVVLGLVVVEVELKVSVVDDDGLVVVSVVVDDDIIEVVEGSGLVVVSVVVDDDIVEVVGGSGSGLIKPLFCINSLKNMADSFGLLCLLGSS